MDFSEYDRDMKKHRDKDMERCGDKDMEKHREDIAILGGSIIRESEELIAIGDEVAKACTEATLKKVLVHRSSYLKNNFYILAMVMGIRRLLLLYPR